jgi:hypothetical protein
MANLTGIRVEVPGRDAEDLFAAKDLEETAGPLATKTGGYPVLLLRAGSVEGKAALASSHLTVTPEMSAEGYALVVGDKRVVVVSRQISIRHILSTHCCIRTSQWAHRRAHPCRLRMWPNS